MREAKVVKNVASRRRARVSSSREHGRRERTHDTSEMRAMEGELCVGRQRTRKERTRRALSFPSRFVLHDESLLTVNKKMCSQQNDNLRFSD